MRLTTKRLILRDLRMSDIESITKNVNNLKISRYLLVVPYPYTTKDAKCFIDKCKKDAKAKPREKYELGIELKSEKKIIGMIGLGKVDKFQGTANIGYWIGENYWRQGITSEALKEVLKFVFNKLKLRRVEASVFKENKASANLLKKFKFKLEGIGRKSHRAKATGKIHDTYSFGLLKKV